MTPDQSPQTVLITGASSGIGRATAEHFHKQGWHVVATMRTPDKETALTALPGVHVTRLDVQEPASIATAVAEGLAAFGGIDALVNNAGYGAYGPLEVTAPEKVRRQFDVNVLGLIATTQALIPHFRAQRSGTIVNISSMGGRITFPLGSLYHGTKFAVEGFSEALHFELAPLGVRVKLVEPGAVRTDFAGRSFDFSNDPALPEYQPLVSTFMQVLEPMMSNAAPPALVADTIFRAVTDGSAQLRYVAGADAEALLAQRSATDDDTFLAGMRAQFGVVV